MAKNQKSKFFRVNEKINFSPVMVIDQMGDNIGIMPTMAAREQAKKAELDLVEISPDARPPVCKIMDFGKFRYDQSSKNKKQKVKHKNTQLKEVRLSPRIAEHDAQVKMRAARKFIGQGHKVNLRLEYKRRENAHKDLGFDIINKIIEDTSDIAMASNPKLEGRFLSCLLEPLKK